MQWYTPETSETAPTLRQLHRDLLLAADGTETLGYLLLDSSEGTEVHNGLGAAITCLGSYQLHLLATLEQRITEMDTGTE